MANPFLYGFRYAGMPAGNMPKPVRCRVASGYQGSKGGNVHIRPGDPVVRISDGTVTLAAVGNNTVFGIVTAIKAFWNTSLNGGALDFGPHLPGGTTYPAQQYESIVEVMPVIPNVPFRCVVDDAVTATTYAGYIAFIGENVDFAYNRITSPNTYANPKLDISTHATTNTLQWRIQDVVGGPGPAIDFSSTNVELIVTCNNPQDIAGTGV